MKRHYIQTALIILLLALVLPMGSSSQNRPYAKYGSHGETIGLFNLMRGSSNCGSWHVINGTITSVRFQKRDKEVDYRVTFRSLGRLRSFAFTLGVEEIPKADIVNLVTANRSVKLRACDASTMLLAEEITQP